jgi:hypothetical protein
MKRKKLWLLVAVVILISCGLWYLTKQKRSGNGEDESARQHISQAVASQTPAASSGAKTASLTPAEAATSLVQQEHERERKTWDALFLTPISFFGKVVDENGTAIAGADVSLSFDNTLAEKKSKQGLVTDDNGLFHVSGHGLGIVVQVSKHGYYHLDKSDGVFGYSRAGGRYDPHSDSASPAIFVLRKMGNAVPLVRLEKFIKTSKNGEPIEISLSTGRAVPSGQGDLKVEAWINDDGHEPNSNQPYDWRCRISILGGGLTQRTGDFSFDAPVEGYTAVDEIDMPASLGTNWRSQATREYFLQLSGDRYARLEFRIVAEGDYFFAIKSFLNVKPGDHNLEFDRSKQVR